MSILIDKDTRVVCQGITGNAGAFHVAQRLEYGPQVVGGVTPGKAGTKSEHGLPIFNNCHDAVAATGADVTVVFVPAPFAADAAMEAAAAGASLVILITNLRNEDVDDLMPGVRLLRRRHLVLVADLREQKLDDVARRPASDFEGALRALGALQHQRERARVGETLRRHRTLHMDVLPSQLSAELINRYYAIKRGGEL